MAETPTAGRKINDLEGVHCVRDAGVAGSNPATPTIHSCHSFLRLFLIADGSRVNRRFPARKRIQSSVLAARLATEACQLHPRRGGCRECRVHAAPAVSCAICARKCAHEHTGTDGTLRHSLRKGAYGDKKSRYINAVRLLCSHLCRDPMLIGVPEETWGHIDAYRAL